MSRAVMQQALEALESCHGGDFSTSTVIHPSFDEQAVYDAIPKLRAALAEPEQPVANYCRECLTYNGHHEGCSHYTQEKVAIAEPEQGPFTDDVTRLMREAGMTFHLGLPHKAVIEQMSRVVDLVYAEASIKAAQQFANELAAPTPRKPLTREQLISLCDAVPVYDITTSDLIALARAIERAHGIKEQEHE